jgi:hypothetical protein
MLQKKAGVKSATYRTRAPTGAVTRVETLHMKIRSGIHKIDAFILTCLLPSDHVGLSTGDQYATQRNRPVHLPRSVQNELPFICQAHRHNAMGFRWNFE